MIFQIWKYVAKYGKYRAKSGKADDNYKVPNLEKALQ